MCREDNYIFKIIIVFIILLIIYYVFFWLGIFGVEDKVIIMKCEKMGKIGNIILN